MAEALSTRKRWSMFASRSENNTDQPRRRWPLILALGFALVAAGCSDTATPVLSTADAADAADAADPVTESADQTPDTVEEVAELVEETTTSTAAPSTTNTASTTTEAPSSADTGSSGALDASAAALARLSEISLNSTSRSDIGWIDDVGPICVVELPGTTLDETTVLLEGDGTALCLSSDRSFDFVYGVLREEGRDWPEVREEFSSEGTEQEAVPFEGGVLQESCGNHEFFLCSTWWTGGGVVVLSNAPSLGESNSFLRENLVPILEWVPSIDLEEVNFGR